MCYIKIRWATLHQFQHMARQWNPYERQPNNQLGKSKRGASLKIPGNEVGYSLQGTSTGSQIIANIKIRWGLYMWLRGVNINCVLTREALFISQLHGEFPRGLSSQDALSAKTRPDEIVDSPIRWTRGCNQDQDKANLTYNHIWQPSSRAANLGTTINSSIDNLLVGSRLIC